MKPFTFQQSKHNAVIKQNTCTQAYGYVFACLCIFSCVIRVK